MSHGFRPLIMALVMCCAMLIAVAQAPIDPMRAQQEKEAEEMYTQGEARMAVNSFEEAIGVFANLMKRYPDTDVRYKAQFRMADAMVGLKQEPKALELLQSVVKEENPDWSPRALVKIGDTYIAMQKYPDAFRAFKQIIVDYPDSTIVDNAYFNIGKLHFIMGHYELAAAALDKVGTAAASQMPDLQRVSPGEPLYIRLTEPNLVAGADSKLVVTVATKSGDKETVTIYPEVEGGDRFTAALPTVLDNAKPNDNILELYGNDTVTLTYKSRYVGTGAVDRTITMATASNARLIIRDSDKNEVRGVVMKDTIIIEVIDADRDTTNNPDSISVEIKTKKKDTEKLTLTETGAHTGVFQASIPTLQAEPKPDSGTIESNADIAQGSTSQLDDLITITYMDEVNLSSKDGGPRKVTSAVTQFVATPGEIKTPSEADTDESLEIKKQLLKGRATTQIASTYKDLGQTVKATQAFKKAAEEFQLVITQHPGAPEVEDALYGQYQNYVAQTNYISAIAIINQITLRFPQSSRASEALMELAALHVKTRNFKQALGIYQNLAQSARGTALAEEAQYAICTTYIEMLKPSSVDDTANNQITAETVAFSLEEFARAYPNSERTPDALYQLVKFRYDLEDYRGAVDNARRMEAMFPDSVMTGRVLLLQAQALVKLRLFDEAITVLKRIIANYGNEEAPARQMLDTLMKKVQPTKPAK